MTIYLVLVWWLFKAPNTPAVHASEKCNKLFDLLTCFFNKFAAVSSVNECLVSIVECGKNAAVLLLQEFVGGVE